MLYSCSMYKVYEVKAKIKPYSKRVEFYNITNPTLSEKSNKHSRYF